MRPEKQRITIAEACGWKDKHELWSGFPVWEHDGIVQYGQKHDKFSCLPNYLNDLNAAHAMEGILTEDQCDAYEVELRRILPSIRVTVGAPFYIWHTTAAQRAQAFLMTLGLWQEETQPVSSP